MNPDIGKRLAALRRAKGITEDALAKFIGVSCKDIIKWENGTEYPPIELLPELAGYYDTTTDAILGADTSGLESKKNGYIKLFGEMLEKENPGGAVDVMREALKHFPKDFRFKYMLMYSLYICCNRPAAVKHFSGEIISLGNEILGSCGDDELRAETRKLLAMHYLVDLKDGDGASECAKGFPSCKTAREAVMPEVTEGDDRLKALQVGILEYSSVLVSMIAKYAESCKELSSANKTEFYETICKIRRMIYPDKDFFESEYSQMRVLQNLAELYANAGRDEDALICLRNAAACAAAYDALPKSLPHISPLVNRLTYTRPKTPENDTGRSCKEIFLYEILTMPCFDKLKYHPEMKDICDILK